MARELCALHVHARRSRVLSALSLMYAHAPGQLRASRTSMRDVETITSGSCHCTRCIAS